MINENNKKVPCGGFYLGDGLTMDGNTLKSLGGEQVQSDYAQNDPTAKDYIKNRPGGYEEGWEITWDGDTTGKTLVAISAAMGYALITDSILSQDDAIGTTIELSNGQVREISSSSIQEVDNNIFLIDDFVIVVSNAPASLPENLDGFTFPESGTYFAYLNGTYVNSIKKISVHQFDDKYIPDTIARKNEVYTQGTHLYYSWDGIAGDKDNIIYDGWGYYKISDIVIPFESVIDAESISSKGTKKTGSLYNGTNCYNAADAIIVTAAGNCKLLLSGTTTEISFTAPSIGVYLPIKDKSTGLYAKSLTLAFAAYNNEKGGLIVNSQSKSWAITVDDSGNISAIEITK